MFRDREHAGQLVADRLRGRPLRDPLVLAIPRGGVVTGAVIARELGADLDVVLARKLRDPWQPELALGALAESGDVILNISEDEVADSLKDYLCRERQHQQAEIDRRRKLFRAVKPAAPIEGRSIILTDDGIATGATMIAGLKVVKARRPHELIVAVPVGSPDRIDQIRKHCDEVICVLEPGFFAAIGQFYQDFSQVEDEEVVRILGEFQQRRSSGVETAVGQPRAKAPAQSKVN